MATTTTTTTNSYQTAQSSNVEMSGVELASTSASASASASAATPAVVDAAESTAKPSSSSTTTTTSEESFNVDDPVWFEPDDHEVVTYIPGIVTNYSPSTQLVTIESSAIDGNIQVFHVANTNVRHRRDFIEANVDNTDDVDGVGHLDIDDMICLRDINKSALFWNLKKRYERNKIYTFIGNILVSMNPYKMFEIYGLNTVKKYQNQLRSALPPHLFAIGNLAYNKMLKDQENQCIMIMGESGSGKTENTKLLLQYFAAINKSSSNIITEQILESIPLLESFGNSKTTRNNNASRYCKYIEVFFNNGVIAGAKTMEFLHEKSRIVSHNQEERNFHIFYELLDGLGETEKEKYGLQVAEKYFYLNQGNCCQIDGKDDAEDFRFLIGAMQVLGFTMEEQDIIFRILASILHLGNVYFHRKQYRHGQEGVEIGSDAEIRWVSHLLQIPIEDIFRLITTRTTETRQERLITPLNIDQALDMRDAFSKVLYVSLFGWLVQRINHIVYNKSLANSTSYSNNNSTTSSSARKQNKIALLDMFGFENLKENNFEQLCINYANELMYHHYTKCVFRNEQSEYMKEKVEWTEVAYPDNQPILNLISKKPIGLLPLLEDESNFPKANDNSYLEKCHYNHALNVIYSRARMTAVEFGIKHFEGQVWYTVEGFLEKNRDILRTDVIDTMLTSKMPIMHKIFGHARETTDYGRPSHINNRTVDGRFVTIKPRAPTVSARFQESLTTLFDGASATNPWFIRCIRPNNERKAMQFDDRIVFDQIHNSSLLETITVRSRGYPIRMRYAQFVSRYHSFLTSQLPRGTPSKEVSRLIVEKKLSHLSSDDYKFGFSKIFLKESAEILLEHDRHENMVKAAITIQAFIRGYLTRRRYRRVRRGIIRIQRTFRGYRQRKNYQTLRRGIVRLQATYRMQRQKQEYERIKTVREKREAERYIMEKSKELSTAMVNGLNGSTANLKQSTTPTINNDSPRVQSSASSNNGVASIDFPNELTNLLSEMDGWKCSHAYNDIIKMVKTVIPLRQRYQSLPFDIDHHSFAKFTNIYFRSQQWGARRDPIKSPFLQKNSDSDVQESLLIFRLILRFMNDNQLSGKKEKLLADYIVQKGLKNIALRDEILCQLCNQTWKNDSQESADNGWTLMIHCLSSFAPSQLLYKYLLKYVSDHSPNPFRPILQRLLLSSDKDEPANSRSFPASLLEWKANLKRCGMSVDLQCPNGDFKLVQLDSWTTGEQLTSDLLHSCGFNQNSNLFGWSVDFDDDGDLYTVNGDDYILDMVSQMELPPSFPASNHHSYIGRKNPYRTAHSSINPFHDPDRLNKINIDHLLSNGGTKRNEPSHVFLKSNVVQRQLNQKMRSLSGETLMRVDGDDGSLGLAVNSKLNERYLLKNHATSLQTFNQLIEADEDENMDVDVDVVVADDRSDNDTELKLSEKSRLNQRYISTNKANELGGKRLHNESRSNRKNLYTRKSDKQSNNKLNNQRSMSMQELGLASSSSLNIRYFSRDKLNKTASLTGGSDNDSDSLNKVQSLMNFGNEQVSSSSLASSPNSDTKQTKPIKPYGRTSSKTNLMARPLPAEPEPIDEYNRIPGVIHRSSGLKGMIRPSSHSSNASSFESDSSSVLNDSDGLPIDKNNGVNGNHHHHYNKKYSSNGKLSNGSPKHHHHQLSKSQQYLNQEFNERSKENDFAIKSSAMSDTSEAPSLASHVRNIRIPSHTSELDQYLDDLFSPVLDANLDDAMSDARSLAQSIKGTIDDIELDDTLPQLDSIHCFNRLIDSKQLSITLMGGVNEVEPSSSSSRMNNIDPNLSNSQIQLNIAGLNVNGPIDSNLLQQQVIQQQMYQMQQRAFLASSLQQNLEIQKQLLQQNQQLQHLLAQAVSPAATSAPSSLTTIETSPIVRGVTQTPVKASDSKVENPTPKSKISIVSPNPSSNGIIKMIPPPPPPPPPPLSPGTDVFGRAKTVRIGKWRWPPPSEENGGIGGNNFIEFKRKKQIEKQQDGNSPPLKHLDSPSEQQNHSPNSSNDNGELPKMEEPSINRNNNNNNNNNNFNNINNNINSSNNKTSISNHNDYHSSSSASSSASSSSSSTPAIAPKDITRKYSDNTIAPGSIGKLRISSEMRAKLEQLTIDQSVRSTKRDRKDPGSNGSGANGSIVVSSQSMDDIANMSSVKKLSEQRKALLERQLMGSLVRNVTTFMETTSTPNIKQSVDIISDHHRKLSKENSSNSNYEPSSHVKKFIKNQQNILRKSGSREFRERREELGPFNRLSASSVHVNYQTDSRPLYTPDRYFQKDGDQSNSVAAGLQFDQDSQSAESSGNGRHSSSSGRFYGNGAFNRSKRMNNPPPPPPMDTASLNGINNHQSVLANKNRHLPLSRSQDRLAFDISDHHHHNHHYGDSRSIMKGFASEFHNGGINIEQKQMKTKLFYKNELNYYAYSKPKFKLNLRKELFSPTETIENPILLDLIFWQIVSDVYTGACIRLNNEQTQSLQCRLKAEGIHGYNPSGYSPKTPFKRSLIDAVKELPTYFSRLYVVSGGKTMPNVDCIGVSHSGVHLLHLERNDGPNNKRDPELIVLEKLNYDDISEILIPSNCTLQILFNGGEWITLYSNKSRQIRNLIEKFVVEHQQSNVEYVRTIKDYVSNEPSVLSFKKDSIIRVVKNRHLHLAKGWSFGVLEFGESGLFQSINVIPLTAQQVQSYQRQMDDETLRNSNHHPHNHSHHQQATPNGNGFNHHHSHHTTTKDETQLENGIAINGGNGSPQDYNSIWIESRTDTIGDDDVKLDLNQLGADNNNSASLSTYGDGNFSLLQFALFNFRESLNKYDLRGHMKDNNSIRGSIKMIENLKSKKKSKSKGDSNDWTWSEFANLVKYSKTLIQSSLLMLSPELNKVAVECFSAIMRYMGDLAMVKNQNEVDCVYTILVNCHKHAPIRDEIYCQLMKQTTSNKSARLDSCQRGWRLFSIVAAYFDCSDTLQPYLFKYLETAAYDKRRAFHVTATIALTNLKKTFKYGGRKNVPSIEEIAAISAGRTSKRQMYRLPGGTERILNTTCTTVVNDIIEEICLMLNVTNGLEMEEFSLYCIIEGDPFTMPLNRDEYILDVTTELLKNGQLFYLIFCRSVWYHPLRLDSHLYIEVVFNQVAPDYLEGLLIIIQHEKLSDDCAQQIARIASLLHRAAEMDQMPSKDEIKYLLPKPVLAMRTIKPHQWVEMVQNHWNDMSALSTIEAKAQCLDILQKWPLFGSCFFAVKRIQNDSHTHPDHILALNKDGVHFLDMVTHEKVWKHPFSEVISTRKVRSEDGTLYLDMKCGNLMVQKITRIQTDQAHEISRLIRQYIEIEQHLKSGRNSQNDDSNISNISISNGSKLQLTNEQ